MYKNRKGVVLVGVLALMVVMMAVLMEFTYRSKVQLDVAYHGSNEARVRLAADSMVDITKAFLAQAVGMDAPELEGLFGEGETFLIDGVEVDVQLEPESTKFNLDRLVRRGNLRNREVRLLFDWVDGLAEEYDEPIMTYDMALSILEWITPEGAVDVDALPGTPAGSEYYRGKVPPYECKHNRLNTISELLLVKGIEEKELYGRPGNENEVATRGMVEFFTLYGNNNRIQEQLQREGLTEDFRDMEPQTDEMYLTIKVTARLDNTQRRISAVVRRDGTRVVELSREAR